MVTRIYRSGRRREPARQTRAAIMAAVFFAFGTADMVPIQAIGIGMGIAVVVDATVVRALLVPATMRLMGEWNWWAPAPLARLHRRLKLDDAH